MCQPLPSWTERPAPETPRKERRLFFIAVNLIETSGAARKGVESDEDPIAPGMYEEIRSRVFIRFIFTLLPLLIPLSFSLFSSSFFPSIFFFLSLFSCPFDPLRFDNDPSSDLQL